MAERYGDDRIDAESHITIMENQSLGSKLGIQVYSGKEFFPLSPEMEDIDITDIAHSLALTCRYRGHCNEFYSVAQHSLLVASLVEDPLDKPWALLHDASEAYLCDMPGPIKERFGVLTRCDLLLQTMIYEKYGLYFGCPEEVIRADKLALATEKRDLLKASYEWNEPLPYPDQQTITPLSWQESERLFLIAFDILFPLERRVIV